MLTFEELFKKISLMNLDTLGKGSDMHTLASSTDGWQLTMSCDFNTDTYSLEIGEFPCQVMYRIMSDNVYIFSWGSTDNKQSCEMIKFFYQIRNKIASEQLKSKRKIRKTKEQAFDKL